MSGGRPRPAIRFQPEDFSGTVRAFLSHVRRSANRKMPMNHIPGSSHYDQAIAERVHDLFRRDCAAFAYDRGSWVTASAHAPHTVPESLFIDEVLERNLMIGLLYDERDRLRRRVSRLENASAKREY